MAMAVARPETLAAPVGLEHVLIQECRQGDARAFARLVSIHERLVYGLAARLLGDAEEARDVSQEVFLQVFRTLDQFQGRSSLKTWIYRIAVNQCHNRRRWWQRRRRGQMVSLDVVTPSEEPRGVRVRARAPARAPRAGPAPAARAGCPALPPAGGAAAA
jgi:DNA-directed RNA polymerase specialized sigma24 family protein